MPLFTLITAWSRPIQWLILDSWCEESSRRRWLRGLGVLFLCAILAWMAWSSLNFYTYHRLYTDAGVFASVSQHWVEGDLLYKEVWDHKPPMIYWLNALPIYWDGGSVEAIRLFERIYGVVGILAFFFILLLVFNNPLLAFVISIGLNLHFYNPTIFQGGNLTEEYAVYFVLVGLFGITMAKQGSQRAAPAFCFLAGFFFSCSVLTKEPFVFSMLPWFVFLLYEKGQASQAVYKKGLFFCIGFASPLLFTLGLFAVQGNLFDWLDVLVYNYNYAQYSRADLAGLSIVPTHIGRITDYIFKQTLTFHLLFLLGLGGCCYLPFVRDYRFWPWAAAGAFFVDFAATMIGGFEIGHYYLQVLPSYLFVCATGVVFPIYLLHGKNWRRLIPLAAVLILFLGLDSTPFQLYRQRLLAPAGRPLAGKLTRFINEVKKEEDSLWCGDGRNAKYYQETALRSPTKYIYIYVHTFMDSLLTTGEEKKQILMDDMMESPPTYIIVAEKDLENFRSFGLGMLVEWIETKYTRTNKVSRDGNVLYVLR